MSSQVRRGRGILAGVVASVLLIIASGCTVGPNFEKPNPKMPAGWIPPTTAPTTNQSVTTVEPADIGRWWRVLKDPQLDSLIDRAVKSNLDLQSAEWRIRQARASRLITRAGLYPTLNSNGGYRRSGAADVTRDLYQAGLDAAWEADIFGGVRRSVEAADANIQSAIEDQRDVLVTLASEIAVNYIDLRGAQREIEIARSNLQAQLRSYDLTKQRAAAGFVGTLDTANAQATVASTESQIPGLEAQVRQTIYTLSILLGQEPGALLSELSSSDVPIPSTPPAIPIGLPSDLLRRRPDVRRAEANLHAATADIGVATAQLFPTFSLTGSIGVQGDTVRSLFNWGANSWSLGPSVSWPVFDAGRIRANIKVQNAFQQQSIIAYQQTVLIALDDVANALIAYEKEQQRHVSLAVAVDANRRAVDLSTQLYTNGQTLFIDVLNAQRSLLATEQALAQSDVAIATDLVALYKALGGGWEGELPEPAAAATTRPAAPDKAP